MKFWIMLLILGWRMSWLSRNNQGFQKHLKDKNFVLQFRTTGGEVARYFHVVDGGIKAYPGLHQQPSMTLAFRNAKYAFDAILAAGKDPAIFMKGIQAKDIKTAGDASLMMWFMGIGKYLVPKKQKRK